MKTYFILLFAILVACAGCEGYSCGTGIVRDMATNLPIDSVRCAVLTGSQVIYTDSSGAFDVCNDFGGCVPKCKDITVEFSKPGYTTTKVENPYNQDILLSR